MLNRKEVKLVRCFNSKKFEFNREIVEGHLMKTTPFIFLVLILIGLGFCTKPRTNGQYAKINGILIFYKLYGEGEPLLLLHGGLGSSDSFKSQVDFFAKAYSVITPDSRGHGRTSDGDQAISYQLMADDMIKLLDHLGIDSVYVVGKSDGGNTGLVMAISYPKRIRKLVAIGSNSRPEGTKDDYMDMISRMTAETAGRNVIENYESLAPDPQHFSILFEKVKKMWLSAPNISQEQLTSMKVRTLLVVGDGDIIKLDHTIELFESIPNAQLCVVPGSSHYVLDERPELLNGIINEFFKEPVLR